ncbi:23914_t:CDS:2, partial [Racocetra persica]
LSNTYNTFDRRVKEIDNRWQEQFESLKNQMDIKLRLLNRFEGMNANDELVYQLSTLQEQLEEYKVVSAHSEELEIKLRTTESRVRELEYREKQAEERLKVEKQGAKEKVESLIENIKDIEAQLQAQNRRNSQLQEMMSMQKASMEEATNESKVREAKVENTFAMLNEQLREQLEEKNKTIENERRRVKNLEDQFSSMLEEQKRLHLQIEGRETMISKVLSGLQMINQRKDVIENAALKNITEDMQIALSLDRKPSYQPPAYINPPWKPAGNNRAVAHPKKTTVKTPSIKSSIPVSSKSKGVNSTKSLIPTPSEKIANEKSYFNKS